MEQLTALYRQTDVGLTEWMARRAVTLLRCRLGVVFFWFGVLKFFPTSARQRTWPSAPLPR